MTPDATQIVLDILEEFQDSNVVFTAYDITVEARERTDENIRHQEVRDIVHGEWDNSEFMPHMNQEEFARLNVYGDYAVVYYPDGKTAQDHPLAIKNVVSQPTKPTSTSKMGGSYPKADGSTVVKATAEGRINIPQKMVDEVAPNSHAVYVEVNGRSFGYDHDADGRYRLTLSQIGLKNRDEVTLSIASDGRSITIS